MADDKGIVLLVPMDSGVLDMALNLFYTSLNPFGIRNHLFLSTDPSGCERAISHGVSGCHVYTSDADAGNSSAFGSSAWRRKVNYKNDMIKNALQNGFTVLLVDVDIVFLKNPMDHVNKGIDHVTKGIDHVTGSGSLSDESWDIVAQWDGYGFNTGFLLVKSNPLTQKFYEAIQHILLEHPELTDQQAFNRALDVSGVPVKVICLPVDLFMHGFTFFTAGKRQFADDKLCLKCVLVHNNYIVGMAHKKYRFQELLLWWNDEKQYYSSTAEQYLTFTMPVGSSKNDQKQMLDKALKLCTRMNRTLILPKFYNGRKRTTLSHIVDVNEFSKLHAYRESVYLLHPLVPDRIKGSRVIMDRITPDVTAAVVHVTNLNNVM